MSEALQAHRDADEANRRAIRELLDETLFVEAGAGTGKTRALVDRYVALVEAGRSVDQLVAITFTEKAAAELRDRVRAELENRLRQGEGAPLLLQNALDGLDRARISTIHAFCLDVLHAFAPELGIDPSFAIQDEVAAERRFEAQWSAFLEDLADRPAERRAVNRALELGLTTYDLEKLAHELWLNPAVAQRLHEAPLRAQPARRANLEALAQRLLDLPMDKVPEGDLLLKQIKPLCSVLLQLMQASDDERDVLIATVVPALRIRRVGQATNWGGTALVENARNVATAVCEALQASLASLRNEALTRLLPSLVRFVMQEIEARGRSGELVFDDLILHVRDVLRDSSDARRRLRARYAALLIDEFQDTDPLQTEIALAFATDPDTGALEPGRLFLVGDPKQSIYRFRRADMAIYASTLSQIEDAGGRTPRLALNHRSRSVVLDFVNAVFERLIGDGGEPEVQPAYQPVHSERRTPLKGPGVGCLGEAVGQPARQVRLLEARQLAAYCREALSQDWQVEDRVEGQRRATYRDIAILVPTRALLQPLERALASAGVPFRVEGGSLVYATQEVRDLINCLTAIDDPTDEVAVVGALRSPAYACSDVELAEYRLDGGSFSYLWPDLDRKSGRVADSLRDLRRPARAAARGHAGRAGRGVRGREACGGGRAVRQRRPQRLPPRPFRHGAGAHLRGGRPREPARLRLLAGAPRR